jgi:hypothetical protein
MDGKCVTMGAASPRLMCAQQMDCDCDMKGYLSNEEHSYRDNENRQLQSTSPVAKLPYAEIACRWRE